MVKRGGMYGIKTIKVNSKVCEITVFLYLLNYIPRCQSKLKHETLREIVYCRATKSEKIIDPNSRHLKKYNHRSESWTPPETSSFFAPS